MRLFGYMTIVAGLLIASYLAVLLSVGDPITGLYARHQQGQLRTELARQQPAAIATQPKRHTASQLTAALPGLAGTTPSSSEAVVGSALGVIAIPRIGLDAVFVEGTGTGELDKAPGHYAQTALPGPDGVIAIAAHRTTHGAWFRHIDRLRKHDLINLDFRGRRYTYSVIGYRIVVPTDWSIIRYRGFPKLVLTSCHPLYSASHRYAVFARLAAVRLLDA